MIKGILATIGLLIVLPFYCLYLIGRAIGALFGVKAKPRPTNRKIRSVRTPAKKAKRVGQSTKEFDIDELEIYDAMFDD